MKILIACEFSGILRDAFIKAGHDAVSCDLLPSETPGPHIQGDVIDVLGDGWDMMVAHPLANIWLYRALDGLKTKWCSKMRLLIFLCSLSMRQ